MTCVFFLHSIFCVFIAQIVTIQHSTAVGPAPVILVCPSCHEHIQTKMEYEASTKTHLFALGLCLLQYVLSIRFHQIRFIKLITNVLLFVFSGVTCASVFPIVWTLVKMQTIIVPNVELLLALILLEKFQIEKHCKRILIFT